MVHHRRCRVTRMSGYRRIESCGAESGEQVPRPVPTAPPQLGRGEARLHPAHPESSGRGSGRQRPIDRRRERPRRGLRDDRGMADPARWQPGAGRTDRANRVPGTLGRSWLCPHRPGDLHRQLLPSPATPRRGGTGTHSPSRRGWWAPRAPAPRRAALASRVRGEIRQDDTSAVPVQGGRATKTDPACRAGDDRDLPVSESLMKLARLGWHTVVAILSGIDAGSGDAAAGQCTHM